ncbi:HNH endonuclease [Thiohalobacter sp. COW1]|uniref:HNH endonuclease n=1 Tax=Thiohalobacter sp. COW1 TaxID=2795687 RepID=UPI0019161D73|nr:HNH endonuclease signature motif containing protein [Thiohalobacter sp. COW1]BCO31187.1 HNH endonuclease [Thiohalobacter sp. COW1]
MPLDVDFSDLLRAVRKMGAEPVDFSVHSQAEPITQIDIELERGIVLNDWNDVDSSNGLLSYKGRQILLYIQDHTRKGVHQTLKDGKKGNRFHISDCKTLKMMREGGRFERYVVTQNLDGDFKVSGEDWHTKEYIEGIAKLQVCQNCLKELNYKGAGNSGARNIAETFDIEEFFSVYSSFFPHLPRRRAGEHEYDSYTKDWAQVAAHYKSEKNFICESCGVDLGGHKKLLHVHHKNGLKGDNSRPNLQALCSCCHREQPLHGQMFIPHADTQLITRLRREQGLLKPTGWTNALRYCDPGLHGLVDALEPHCSIAPEVGLDVQDSSYAVVANLELAWPETRIGIAISEEDREAARKAGWSVWTMIEALQNIQGLASHACGEIKPARVMEL